MEGLNEISTAIRSENFQLLQNYIETYRKKLQEKVIAEEEFIRRKISNKDAYVDYGAMSDILEDAVI